MEEERNQRHAVVNLELERSERFLQPIPAISGPILDYADDKVRQVLEETQRQISEINSLLLK